MIAPQWWQYDVFALWERNRQSRCYFRMLNQPKDAIRGFARLFRLALLPHLEEPTWPRLEVPETGTSKIVDFYGTGNYFEELVHYRDYVRSELLAMVRPSHLGCRDIDFNNSIMVHVRLGDFSAPVVSCPSDPGFYNQRTPIEWYTGAVQTLRESFGAEWPAYILSDGTGDELRSLLKLKNIHRLKLGSLAGLLTLSRARVLVASGSTYSMWASFLGNMPVLWPLGQRRQFLYPGRSTEEPEWSPGDRLPVGFLEAVARQSNCGYHYAFAGQNSFATPSE